MESRKAHRHHPAAFEAAANRPIPHPPALDGGHLDGIPRARVVPARPPAPRKQVVPVGGEHQVKRARPVPFRLFKRPQPAPTPVSMPAPQPVRKAPLPPRPAISTFPMSPSPATLVRRCDVMALEGLEYKFGSESPSSGGLDCSGAVQYLLGQEGIRDVPRTAFAQYQWLKRMGALSTVSRWTWSANRLERRLRTGDLLFWKGTYKTGNNPNISHVMIYLGKDARNGKHYMFGASSRRSKGLHGNAVDVYEFVYPNKSGKNNFVGFGSVPGLRR